MQSTPVLYSRVDVNSTSWCVQRFEYFWRFPIDTVELVSCLNTILTPWTPSQQTTITPWKYHVKSGKWQGPSSSRLIDSWPLISFQSWVLVWVSESSLDRIIWDPSLSNLWRRSYLILNQSIFACINTYVVHYHREFTYVKKGRSGYPWNQKAIKEKTSTIALPCHHFDASNRLAEEIINS